MHWLTSQMSSKDTLCSSHQGGSSGSGTCAQQQKLLLSRLLS
jgi:hypothetical protein